MMEFQVATEFSRYPGGRYANNGSFSGEAFRERLYPLLKRAIETNDRLRVIFDGVQGLPPSFMEEAFGGMIRTHPELPLETIRSHLELVAPQSPRLWPWVELAETFMEHAAAARREARPS